MDGRRFDEITQRLTASVNRRRGLAWLTLLGVPHLITSSVAGSRS